MPAETRARFVAAARAAVLAAAALAGGCAMEARYQPATPAARRAEEVARAPVVVAAPQFDEAVALVSDLKYVEAETKFRQLAVWSEAAGDKDRAAECMFWIGFCLEKQGNLPDARAQYDKVIRDLPNTTAATLAAERLRRLAQPPVREGLGS